MDEHTAWQRRYNRHILLSELGEEGQRKLTNARVLVVGAGGLGAASLSYLAAAGIGTIGVVDFDHVERSNLQRQILFEEGDISRPKTDAARDRLEELNPDCTVEVHKHRVDADNAEALVSAYDIVLDGCDDFATRFAVNAACTAQKKPLISAAIAGWEGQISAFAPHMNAPCYRCFVAEIPPEAATCSQSGVIGPLCGVMGSMQALEAIKLVVGTGNPLFGRLLRYDALQHSWKESALQRDPACPCCSNTNSV